MSRFKLRLWRQPHGPSWSMKRMGYLGSPCAWKLITGVLRLNDVGSLPEASHRHVWRRSRKGCELGPALHPCSDGLVECHEIELHRTADPTNSWAMLRRRTERVEFSSFIFGEPI
jgi:hypothetical protein